MVAICVLALAAVVWLVFPHSGGKPHLRLHAGAGLRSAVEQLVAAFEKNTGIRVEPDYGRIPTPLVSHDRDVVESPAERVVEIAGGHASEGVGGYRCRGGAAGRPPSGTA